MAASPAIAGCDSLQNPRQGRYQNKAIYAVLAYEMGAFIGLLQLPRGHPPDYLHDQLHRGGAPADIPGFSSSCALISRAPPVRIHGLALVRTLARLLMVRRCLRCARDLLPVGLLGWRNVPVSGDAGARSAIPVAV